MRHIDAESWDVLVFGGTPAGIMAAIAAAREGRRVALVERESHLGGMSTNGLGKSDIENRSAVGGLFREFVERIYRDYASRYGADSDEVRLCRNGYYYEPSVAERVFEQMLAGEPRVTVLRRQRLIKAETAGDRLVSILVADRASEVRQTLEAQAFVDASYEGDLAAAAGAEFRLGRESRSEFNEPHAGVIYLHYESGEILPGSTGKGDDRLPAYTYRLCLTTDPANSVVLREPPPNYDRNRYVGYLQDLAADRFVAPKKYREGWGYEPEHYDTLVRALSVTKLPNQKTDVNINPRPLGFPFAEENVGYVEGTDVEREAICRKHRDLTLGLLYFLQNDEDVPRAHRAIARQYHLPKDEFRDNGHFSRQIYVREARRIIGEHVLSENEVTLAPGKQRTTVHCDSIAAGEFPIDSFPVRKYEAGREHVLEGYLSMLEDITSPYQIPYRIMVPRRVDGLLVPVAASTTHVAFSTIRMEPCWMVMGQAAGVAAAQSIEEKTLPRNVSIDRLQQRLIDQGQVLTYFSDLESSGAHLPAVQYFGTKGFFPDYEARLDESADRATGATWLRRSLECAGIVVPPASDLPTWPDFNSSDEGFDDVAALAAIGATESQFESDCFFPSAALEPASLREWLGGLAVWLEKHQRHAVSGHLGRPSNRELYSAPQLVVTNGHPTITRGQLCSLLYQLVQQILLDGQPADRPATVLQGPHAIPAPSGRPHEDLLR